MSICLNFSLTKGERRGHKGIFICHPAPPETHKKQEKLFSQEILADLAVEAGLLGYQMMKDATD